MEKDQPFKKDFKREQTKLYPHTQSNSLLCLSCCTAKGFLCFVVNAHKNSYVQIPMGMAVEPKLSGV